MTNLRLFSASGTMFYVQVVKGHLPEVVRIGKRLFVQNGPGDEEYHEAQGVYEVET